MSASRSRWHRHKQASKHEIQTYTWKVHGCGQCGDDGLDKLLGVIGSVVLDVEAQLTLKTRELGELALAHYVAFQSKTTLRPKVWIRVL